MKASIIILNWNGGAENCLEAANSAAAQDYPNKEIIFVDNASSDGSDIAVHDAHPDFIFIQTGDNYGCPGGRNFGARAATGDILFFLENDGAWASTDVVSEAVKLFQRHPRLGALYTAVEGYHTGKTDAPIDRGVDVTIRNGLYLSSTFRGGASAIRRDLFLRLGLFPDDFIRQYEENYVALLIYDAGYSIAYWPERVLRHKGSDYPGKSGTVLKFNVVNELKMIARIYPPKFWVPFLLLRLIIALYRVCRSQFYSMLPDILKTLHHEKLSRSGCTRVKMKTLIKTMRLRRTSNSPFYNE